VCAETQTPADSAGGSAAPPPTPLAPPSCACASTCAAAAEIAARAPAVHCRRSERPDVALDERLRIGRLARRAVRAVAAAHRAVSARELDRLVAERAERLEGHGERRLARRCRRVDLSVRRCAEMLARRHCRTLRTLFKTATRTTRTTLP
jgi:hypothetical protein